MAKRTRRCVDCKTDISNRGNKSTRCKPCQAALRDQRERLDPSRARCIDDDGTCSPSRLKRGRCSRHYYTARRDNGWQIPQQPRACAACGVVFTPVRSDAVCCSSECNWRKQDARRRAVLPARSCTTCRAWYAPRRSDQKYCGTDCIPNPRVRAHRKWAQANPGKFSNACNRRRVRLEANPFSVGVSDRDWRRLVNRYGGRCAYCGDKPDRVAMDHVVPLARGGRHAIGNVLPACLECNSAKRDLLLADFRRREVVNAPRRRAAKKRLAERFGGERGVAGRHRFEQLALGIRCEPVRRASPQVGVTAGHGAGS
ncbi:HNH endonuclease [Micromonospora sp. NPDC006766]|uniref:HNH endonuclease n=1 Tax=Micromonospora sp. NPDC006766 TaxID=3154778 RepID=UPI0034011920